jgi:hypothetical protein
MRHELEQAACRDKRQKLAKVYLQKRGYVRFNRRSPAVTGLAATALGALI